MKIWKRLTAAAVALTMSASVWATAACGFLNPNDDDDKGGNGGNTGGNGGSVVTGEDVSAIVTALKGQELDTVLVNVNQTMTGEDVAKFIDSDGAYLDDYYTTESSSTSITDIKVNVADGDMDMVALMEYTSLRKDLYDTEAEDSYYKGKDIDYEFMRNGYSFSYSDRNYIDDMDEELVLEEITDWSGIELDYDGEIPVDMGLLTNYGSLVNAVILNLASAADAVTLTEGKATVDINKLAHNVIVDIYNALEGYTVNTTIGDVLQNGIIAKYLSSIFNIFTIDEVKGLLELYLGESYEYVEPLFEAVQPDANSATYDYIVKLVKSAELKEFINSMIGESVFESTLDNLTLGFIIQMITQSMPGDDDNGSSGKVESRAARAVADADDDIDYLALARTYLGELAKKITATELKIEADGMTVKNAKMEYTLNSDNTVASQKISLDITMEGAKVGDGSFTDNNGEYREYEIIETSEMSIVGIIEYTSTKATLADISGCTVEEKDYRVADGVYTGTNNVRVNYSGYESWVTLTGSITIENGDIAGICIEDEEGNVLTRYLDVPFELEVTFEYWENEQLEQFTVPVEFNAYLQSLADADNGKLRWVELSVRSFGVGLSYITGAYAEDVYLTNTVAGILNGTPWTTVAN